MVTTLSEISREFRFNKASCQKLALTDIEPSKFGSKSLTNSNDSFNDRVFP